MMFLRLSLRTWVLTVLTAVVTLSTAGFAYATYSRLYNVILEGFDKKVSAIASAESVFIDGDELLTLLALQPKFEAAKEDPEQHPLYTKYAKPMQQVWRKGGLTFAYTQILLPGSGQRCKYIVDGTIGEGHSELGDEDTIPEDDWHVALRVQHDGVVAQTAIRQWQQWGLLKCGWAPIYGKDGLVKAQAGADVEITIIRQKTYTALFETLAVGVVAILVAGAVSIRVARRLTQPLSDASEAALRVASGDYEFRCRIDNPREMRDLADGLNLLARMMHDTVLEGRRRLSEWQRERAAQTLLERLALPAYRSPVLSIASFADAGSSGYVVEESLVLLWLGGREGDELEQRKLARDIETIAGRLLRADGAAAGEKLMALFASRVHGWVSVDLQTWQLRAYGDGLQVVVDRAGQERVVLSGVDLTPGETAIVVPAAAAAAARVAIELGAATAIHSADATLDTVCSVLADHEGGVAAVIHRPAAIAERGEAA